MWLFLFHGDVDLARTTDVSRYKDQQWSNSSPNLWIWKVTADIEEEELHGIITDFKYSIENYTNVFRKRASQKL